MTYLRWLLLPFSWLYGAIVWLRNRFYDWGWLPRTGFDKPVIVIGNLEAGGTGKTPMTEYLIRLLSDKYGLATLSRGYGRKTSGFLMVSEESTAAAAGDEPLQFKRKFPQITVAVDADRVAGISRLIGSHDLILLDDAFQHRSLKPGLSILLFDYNSLGGPKFLLPAGNFRDCFSERKRADVLIVTKCPPGLGDGEKQKILRSLQTDPGQAVLFAGMGYGEPLPVFPASPAFGHDSAAAVSSPDESDGFYVSRPAEKPGQAADQVLLVTGIAKPKPLVDYLQTRAVRLDHLDFPDHHRFSVGDMDLIRRRFGALPGPAGRKRILTTEKDARRLETSSFSARISDLPLYYVPMHIIFDPEDQKLLEKTILSYCSAQRIAGQGD